MVRVKSIAVKSPEQRRSKGLKGLKSLKAMKHPVAAEQDETKKKWRKPPKFHPGTVALREIRREQKSTNSIIPAARVSRICRKFSDLIKPGTRFKRAAFVALHAGLEDALIKVFGDGQLFALHAHRVTVSDRDVNLARFLISRNSAVQTNRPASSSG